MTFRSRTGRPRSRRRVALLLALASTSVGAALPAAQAVAAPAQVPCSAIGGGKHNCGFSIAGNGYTGGSPVQNGKGTRIGYLPKGTNYVLCQAAGGTVKRGPYFNNVWAWTTAENGRDGWVNAVYASGGDNNGGFQGVPGCAGAHGAPPGGTATAPPSGGGGSGGGGGDQGGGGDSTVPATPTGCKRDARFGPVHVVGSCLKVDRSGSVFTLSGNARANINGLTVTTGRTGKLVVNVGKRTIKANAGVTLSLGKISLGTRAFSWSPAKEPVSFGLSKAVKIKGMPLVGSISFDFNAKDQLVATANASIGPDFGNVTGKLELRADRVNGVSLGDLKIGLEDSSLKIGKIGIQSAGIEYIADEDLWRGDAQIGLPGGRYVKGSLGIQNASFHDASVDAGGLNVPIGAVLYLQSIGASVSTDPLSIEGRASFTAGPKIKAFGDEVSAVEGDGDLKYTDGSPDTYEVKGGFKLAGFDVGDAFVKYSVGQSLDFGANFDAKVGPVGIEAGISGWIEGISRFNIEGDGRLDFPILGVDGKVILSSEGISACGKKSFLFYTQSLGLSYRWGDSFPDLFTDSCNHSDIEVERASTRAVAPGTVTVGLPSSKTTTLLSIPGSTGAPRVQVTGPGVSIAPGANGAAYVKDSAYLVESPNQKKTFVVLNKPKKGTYTIKVLPGGVPPSTVKVVPNLKDVKVSARVKARGTRKSLSYRIRTIRGQKVQFVERGPGIAKPVGTRRDAKGRLRFTPTLGRSGRRSIQAVVLQNGLVRDTRLVARYRYNYRRPAKPTGIKLRRYGNGMRVTWKQRGRTTGFEVTLRTADGAKLFRVVSKRRRSAVFANLPKADAKVSVVATGLPKGDSKTGRATYDATPKRRRRR